MATALCEGLCASPVYLKNFMKKKKTQAHLCETVKLKPKRNVSCKSRHCHQCEVEQKLIHFTKGVNQYSALQVTLEIVTDLSEHLHFNNNRDADTEWCLTKVFVL